MAVLYSYWQRMPTSKISNYFFTGIGTFLTAIFNMSKFTADHLELLFKKIYVQVS